PTLAQVEAHADGGLEEIVVTAQKRSENLQETPLAVSAVTAQMIEQRGISDITSLTAIAPNLSITTTGSSTSNIALFVRGIGESETILTVDSPVGLYVDGVVLGRSSGAVFDMVDLERIEVLRGPQGTLYGRNTIGGAVNLISRKPTEVAGAEQMVGFGNLGLLQSKTTLNSGDFADVGLRAQMTYLHKQRNGYVDNRLMPGNRDPGTHNVDALRLALDFNNQGPFRLTYVFDLSDRQSAANPFQLTSARPDILAYLNASTALGGATPVLSRNRLSSLSLDRDGLIKDSVLGHALTAELDLADDLTLRSITSYRKWSNTVVSDLDGNAGLAGFVVDPVLFAGGPFIPLGVQPINLFSLTFDRDQHQWTQEINLLGKIGETTRFTLGGYYFDEVANEENPTFLTFIVPSPNPIPVTPSVSVDSFGVNIAGNIIYRYTSRSTALFGQVTQELGNRLSVTGGLRYTHDQKRLEQQLPFTRALDRRFNKFNWAVTLDYKWTDDVMTYARVATGYKAGGFSARSANDGFEPENLTSYEIGVKSELLDRRIRFNAALFHAVHKDVQIGQFLAGSGGSLGITVNAGKAVYTGVEAELTALVADNLTINGNIGYLDRKFKSFEILNPQTDKLVELGSSARFQYSPNMTANAGMEYSLPGFGIGTLTARLDYTYRSRMYWHASTLLNPFNDLISDGPVGRFDGRLTLSDIRLGGAQTTVALWVKNIANADYLLGGVDFGALGFSTVGFAEPRTWGVDFRLKL
ncbi:MAG: TonB-dependent receptor, partial [Sphingorhabdus sp.]